MACSINDLSVGLVRMPESIRGAIEDNLSDSHMILWMVDANFIFFLVFISSYFRSVWHPFGCFILRMVYLFCVAFLYTFSSCSFHIVNTFFKVLAPGIWLICHNAVNTRSQSRTHRQFRAHAQYGKCLLGSELLKIEDQ